MILYKKVIITIFGSEFINDGALTLATLALSNFVNCLSGGLAYTLAMTGKQKIEFFNSLWQKG